MAWNSFGEFMHMGGYGFYVWLSASITLLYICAEVILLRRRKRIAITEVRRLRQVAAQKVPDLDRTQTHENALESGNP